MSEGWAKKEVHRNPVRRLCLTQLGWEIGRLAFQVLVLSCTGATVAALCGSAIPMEVLLRSPHALGNHVCSCHARRQEHLHPAHNSALGNTITELADATGKSGRTHIHLGVGRLLDRVGGWNESCTCILVPCPTPTQRRVVRIS